MFQYLLADHCSVLANYHSFLLRSLHWIQIRCPLYASGREADAPVCTLTRRRKSRFSALGSGFLRGIAPLRSASRLKPREPDSAFCSMLVRSDRVIIEHSSNLFHYILNVQKMQEFFSGFFFFIDMGLQIISNFAQSVLYLVSLRNLSTLCSRSFFQIIFHLRLFMRSQRGFMQ